ncbi:hypothetical protein LCGC14_2726690 [marine sediment metagenome]|uniref:Uncharacterized protein n=1 Tax=marine sediment metagenome TaxID=412755 RepID=A0A0F8Z8G9_9ZZZZ
MFHPCACLLFADSKRRQGRNGQSGRTSLTLTPSDKQEQQQTQIISPIQIQPLPQLPKQIQPQPQLQQPAQDVLQRQRLAEAQRFAQAQRLRFDQLTLQQQRLRQRLRLREGKIGEPTVPKIPLIPLIPEVNGGDVSLRGIAGKLKRAFEVQVRREGKFKKISKNGLPLGKALELGQQRTITTLAATFRLVPKGFTTKKDVKTMIDFDIFRLPKRTPEFPLTFIEKKGKRLKRGTGEIAEIMRAKALAPIRRRKSKKKKRGNMFGM